LQIDRGRAVESRAMNYYQMEQVGRLRDKERLREAEHARLVREIRRLRPSRRAALLAWLRTVGARLWQGRRADGVGERGSSYGVTAGRGAE
jgi:hypothetical protein